MIRRILATLLGLLVGMALVAVVEKLGHLIWPPPEGIDWANPESVKAAMATMPLGALLSVVAAWFVGALGGCYTAAWTGRRRWPAWVVGALLLAATLLNLVMIPHPLWMSVVGPLVVVTGCLGGAVLGMRRVAAMARTS